MGADCQYIVLLINVKDNNHDCHTERSALAGDGVQHAVESADFPALRLQDVVQLRQLVLLGRCNTVT